jgi:hypothetical protein
MSWASSPLSGLHLKELPVYSCTKMFGVKDMMMANWKSESEGKE